MLFYDVYSENSQIKKIIIHENHERRITFREFFENILKTPKICILIRDAVLYVSSHYFNDSQVYIEFPNMKHLDEPFSFNVIKADDLDGETIDPSTFDEYFNKFDETVEFMNTSNDTLLICPNKKGDWRGFNTILNFFKVCKDKTLFDMFIKVGEEILNGNYRYLSTHGHGVPWLHLRLSNNKKYYHSY